MLRKILKVILWLLLAFVLFIAVQAFRYRDIIQRTMLGGVHDHETVPPQIPANLAHPAILVFSKTNAFRHEEAIPAGNKLFADLARVKGWGYFQTENGAAFRPEILAKFDAVVFNNVSGDVFSDDQKAALKQFIENGGGYVGIHAAGDNSHEGWPWYQNEVIGAKFTMHTMKPQFQVATVKLEPRVHPISDTLPDSWQRTEEWYSFAKSPRDLGYGIIATVDEKTYNPEGMFGKDLRMGADHPVAWRHCQGKGRVFYTSFGHRAEAFAETETRNLLRGSLEWAVNSDKDACDFTGIKPPPPETSNRKESSK